MAETKSVTFSPILEQVSDEVSVGSTETDFLPDETKVEDAYVASLSKSGRKYQLPCEDERIVPPRRKIALLTLAFILLLGIGGVVIYLITRELYNREQHYYSGVVSENKTGFVSGNTSIKDSVISVDSLNTMQSSSESSKKQFSWYSAQTTVRSLSEETTSVARTLTPTTIIQSSGLVTRHETKKGVQTRSTFTTPKLSSPRTTTLQWLSRQDSTKLYTRTSETIRHSPESGERKITTSYYPDHGTSSWNVDDLSESGTSTESGFLTSVSSLNIARSTGYLTEGNAKSPVIQNASYNTSSLFTKKRSTIGTLTTIAQDIRTLISGAISSGIKTLPRFEYSESVGVNIDLQITTKRRDRSKLSATSSSAVTYHWGTSETVDQSIGGTDMTASILSPTTKSSLPSSLSYKLSDATNVVNSLENTFSNEWVSSQPIPPITLDGKYNTTVKETSHPMKSFSDHSRNTLSMPVSHTPAVGFSIHESVLSFRKVHETSHSALLISTESKLARSGSLMNDFTTVVMQPFSPSSLLTNQESSVVKKVFAPTKATSLAVTQRSNPSTLGSQSTNLVLMQTENVSLNILTSPRYTRQYGISTARDVTSLKTTTFPSSLLQTRPSISQPQSGIKATSFGSALLKANSGTKSSSLGASPSELNSLPVPMVSTYGSVSSHTTYDYLPTFTPEADTNGFSSWIATQKIVSYSPSSNFKPPLASRKVSMQQWHAARSTDPVRHLNPKSSVKESLTNLTSQTMKPGPTYQQTLQKGTSDALQLSTVTRSPITPVSLSLKQSTIFSQGLQSIAQSFSTGQPTTGRISSHSENTQLSTVTFSRVHLTSTNPYETSQHQNWYTTASMISTITRFSITRVMSNTTTIADPASRTKFSQLENAGFSSSISFTPYPSTRESLNVSPSSKKAYSVSIMELYNTLVNGSSDTLKNTTGTQSSIATMSLQSTIFSPNKSASRSITLASNVHNTTHSQYALAMETVRIFPSPINISTTQLKPLKTTYSYSFSAVLTNTMPTSNPTAQFKIMDGSLVIRNRKFHANLSNPNTTMFKTLATEVEEIIMDIVSLDAEVTSFRNGSIVASFYLLVAYDSLFSDRDYVQILSEANETLWRGYQVANITVTLRAYTQRSAARSQDDGGLSKAAFAAIFTVFSVLLVAVGCFGVYICKKKGLCKQSRVKPADSPIPPPELEKIQPVRRGTWAMNEELFLKVDVPQDQNNRSASFYETLNMTVMERNNTETDEGFDPDLLRKSTSSPFEPEYADSEANNDSGTKSVLPLPSRSVSSTMMKIDYVDRPISGSSRNTYLNIPSDSTHTEDKC